MFVALDIKFSLLKGFSVFLKLKWVFNFRAQIEERKNRGRGRNEHREMKKKQRLVLKFKN